MSKGVVIHLLVHDTDIHAKNPNTWQAKVGGLLQAQGQPRLHSKTLFSKLKNLGVVVHVYNLSSREAETSGSLRLTPTSEIYLTNTRTLKRPVSDGSGHYLRNGI